MATLKQIHGRQFDVRDMLLKAGIGQYNAQLAIPYMWFLPRTSDPYAQGIMMIVEGLQRLLNQRGARLAVDGGLGVKTVAALVKYSGASWYDKNWVQLYGDVLQGDRWAGYERAQRAQTQQAIAGWESDLGSTSFVGDLLASPIPWLAAGALAYWKWFR